MGPAPPTPCYQKANRQPLYNLQGKHMTVELLFLEMSLNNYEPVDNT